MHHSRELLYFIVLADTIFHDTDVGRIFFVRGLCVHAPVRTCALYKDRESLSKKKEREDKKREEAREIQHQIYPLQTSNISRLYPLSVIG
jgi:hypothetical protein